MMGIDKLVTCSNPQTKTAIFWFSPEDELGGYTYHGVEELGKENPKGLGLGLGDCL